MTNKPTTENLQPRPPIVVVLGHVDHGKTTLLDAIRKTNVVEKEAGGITQHIGAYQITHNGKLITFIDTPGHEAFSQMRSRGAKVADIAILVIAAEEGVKPQTKEVISYIKKRKIPVIIALNKMDKPQANPEKVIGELEKQGLLVEERGGQVLSIKVSAKEKTGINELLEMILLVAEMEELPVRPEGGKADVEKPATGVVIESYLDSKRGATATFLVLEGVLKVAQWVVCGDCYGKIRILEDFQGSQITEASPSFPAIVIGLNKVPVVGERFSVCSSEQEAKDMIVEKEKLKPSPIVESKVDQLASLSRSGPKEGKLLNLILKADVQGSLEAIKDNLVKIDLQGIGLNILKCEVGEISESDIKTAYPTNALIIGFRVKVPTDISNLAKRSGVKIRTHEVIYELFEGIKKQAGKLLEPEITREDLGKLKVLAIFRKEKSRMIVGGKVIDGKVVNKASIDVFRNEEKIASGKIIQLQHNKQDMAEVEKGREAGILFEGEPVIEEGDVLEVYKKETKKREL